MLGPRGTDRADVQSVPKCFLHTLALLPLILRLSFPNFGKQSFSEILFFLFGLGAGERMGRPGRGSTGSRLGSGQPLPLGLWFLKSFTDFSGYLFVLVNYT